MITVQTSITRQMVQWINEDYDRREVVRFYHDQCPNPWYYLSDLNIKMERTGNYRCVLRYKPMREDLLHIPDEVYADVQMQIEDFARAHWDGENTATYYFDDSEIMHEGDDFTLGVSGCVYYSIKHYKGTYDTPDDYEETIEIKISDFTCTGESDEEIIKCDFNKSYFL